MSDPFSPSAHFRAFGFVVLRGAIAPAELDALTRESDRAIRDATGDRYRDDAGGTSNGHYIPATGERTPVSAAMVRRLAPALERLAGVALLPAVVEHNLLFDQVGWHTDTAHAVPSLHAVAYLEELDERSGALRVLPGSQHLDESVLREVLQGQPFRDDATWRAAVAAVPAHAIASRPGDVIVFDEHLWHASHGGRDRHQWSASFVLDPRRPAEELAVRRYLASQFDAGAELDYDPTHYPWYGCGLRDGCPPRWYAQLRRLGAVAAADAEQWGARGSGRAGEAPMTAE
ncbi:phytanoyl-CoA dioxygenase family protein [Pseudonocardia lacus]|uniref:phytanoyl-CoA dioxygenase family protein n=1 Tax=Pseudonocardia lacus TaxID=2835865 RepID=UPI001BDDBB88|nr:phytanoyl-CoA dioxygenase family protein [Pseudonocardia lacus]